jgi:CheY-like chemotaxis protein
MKMILMKKILLIDDEIDPSATEPHGDYMWYYFEALQERKMDVKRAVGPDDALDLLSAEKGLFDLVIVDIMMPPGKTLAGEETGNGLRTGIAITEKIVELYPSIQIVVLTNSRDPEIQRRLGNRKANVERIMAKSDFTPFQFADEVRKLLA